MFLIKIVKQGQVTNSAEFNTQEEYELWLSFHQGLKTFGEPSQTIQQITTEAVPPVIDEQGNVIEEGIPAVYEDVVIPGSYDVVIEDITAQKEQESLINGKKEKGRLARQACEDVLDLIAGFNLDRELTAEQITEMQTVFSNPEKALRAARPSTAKALITGITPDDVLVTQEMKDLCLQLLSSY